MQPEQVENIEQGDCGEQGQDKQSGEASPTTTVPGTPEVPMDRADDFPKLVLAGLAETYGDEEPSPEKKHEGNAGSLLASTSGPTDSSKTDPRRPL